jgi:hypothetical protein
MILKKKKKLDRAKLFITEIYWLNKSDLGCDSYIKNLFIRQDINVNPIPKSRINLFAEYRRHYKINHVTNNLLQVGIKNFYSDDLNF